MSINKRRHSLDKVTRGDAESQPDSLRKKPRLSPIKELERDGKLLNPMVIEEDDCRHTSAPTRLFRPYHQLGRISAETRSFNSIRHRPKLSPNSAPYSSPPELFDVSPSLPVVVPPADGEMSLWKAEHAGFIKSAAGLSNSQWIGKRPLGSGSFGTAGLWERRDENNVVIEVM